MELQSKIYNDLIIYSKRLLWKNKDSLTGREYLFNETDLAAEGFLKSQEDKHLAIKAINAFFFTELRMTFASVQFTDFKSLRNAIRATSDYCRKCNQEKPISSFRLQSKPTTGFTYTYCICNDCENKRKNGANEQEKKIINEKRRTASKESTKIKEQTAKRVAEFWKKESEILSDKYIVKNIKGKNKNIVITPEMIESKRVKIIELRKKKYK
mgnify:FL=1